VLGLDILIILCEKVIKIRAYTVAATAVTLGVSKKWVDNVLSHHQVNGVHQARQGIVRRVTPDGLLALEIALALGRTLSIPIARALEISRDVIASRGGTIQLGGSPSITLQFDIDAMSRALGARLAHALEMTPVPKRGRPRYK
jgi:hypothetical protein